MRRITTFLCFLLLAGSLPAQGQKRALTHDDYKNWRSFGGATISRDGRWVALAVRAQEGDGELIVRSSTGDTVYRHPLGTGPRFTEDGRFVVFRVAVARDAKRSYDLEKLKRRKKAREEAGGGARPGGARRFGRRGGGRRSGGAGASGEDEDDGPDEPKPTVGIMDLTTGRVEIVEKVKNFQVPAEGPSVAVFHMEKPKPERSARTGRGRRGPGARPGGRRPGARGRRGRGRAAEERGSEEKKTAAGAGAKKEAAKKEKKKSKKYLKDGTTLVVRDLLSGKQTRIAGVLSYGITPKKGILYWSASSKDKPVKKAEGGKPAGGDTGAKKAPDAKPDAARRKSRKEKPEPKVERGLFAMDLKSGKRFTLVAGAANYRGFATDREVTRFVFVSDREDRDAKKPTFAVYAWDLKSPGARMVISHETTAGFPKGWMVAAGRGASARGGRGVPRRFRGRGRFRGAGGGSRFSRDGRVLQFGIQKLPEKDLPDILPEDKVTMDLWHWKDPLLQPMQALQAGRNRNALLACVWHFDDGRMTVLATDPRESVRLITDDGSRALITDSTPYAQEISWDGRYQDVYVANTVDGSRKRILTHARSSAQPSPLGRYLTWFADGIWYCHDLVSGTTSNLTGKIGVPFEVEDWDTPQAPRPHGIAGWTAGEKSILIYDRFDIWEVRPDGSNARCVTDGYGRANELRFRYTNLDPEARHVPTNAPILLATTNLETMASGYYTDRVDGLARPRKLVMKNAAFRRLSKGRKSERLFFQLTRFEQFGDLWTCLPDFKDLRRLSDVNPQQKDFRWGKAELVRWTSGDGRPLKGILVKPDGFDPRKKYPMMVYFYEKLSNGLHNYRSPSPGTSPNAAYYVSNGYLWFMPDIVYREGYPGESCLKCVVPGVQNLIDRGFVKEDAIGAAGHSWGGYQTAYLVTRTNIFKAVESGAPVSNMTSAYGGIRWGSGMSRAFQYERTQSRIGGSLWEYPLRYIENSPIFSADKVQTPVLMLHNDEDGAVPWYQGIEYFCALRRLGKEVYMFNYNGSGHGLRRRANTMDWTRRMQQYFDHHLKGAPAPAWMADGVPYVDREKEKIEYNPPKYPGKPGAPATPTVVPAGGGSR